MNFVVFSAEFEFDLGEVEGEEFGDGGERKRREEPSFTSLSLGVDLGEEETDDEAVGVGGRIGTGDEMGIAESDLESECDGVTGEERFNEEANNFNGDFAFESASE